MAVNWPSFRAGLRRACELTWPETQRDQGGGGIITVPRLDLIALEDLPPSADAIATLAVIQTAPPQVQPELTGIANHFWSVEVLFHYVRRRDMVTDMEEFAEGRLAALQEYLLHTALAVGQCIDVVSLDVSETNPANAIILEKNKAYYAGSLGAVFEVGDSPT